MRLPLIVLIAATVLCGALSSSTADAQSAKIKLLLITGDDVGSHKWQETAPATRDILVKSGKFDVKVVEDLSCLENADELKSYDVIFLHRFHRGAVPSDKAKENLLSFVKSGKGFVVAHLASASFGPTVKKTGDKIEVTQKGWEEFGKLCGRIWIMKVSGHGPHAPFKVKIADKNNPITKGMEDFEADDELYAKLQGDTKINVLATADSDWSKKTEPLVFTLNYGKGRVFYEAFGHDTRVLENASIAKIICRGCEWAATGKVK
ncbi:MAG: ThuA domain-containing protein [Verrucomicrobia bacterium]|nr:ThuA domain-containing protein [Verrucomicrobiota bacterium]